MLIGQEIGFYETVIISLLGMAVVLVSLTFLMGFVLLFSKLFSEKPASTAQASSADVSEEEIAVIAVSLGQEQALAANPFIITSINLRKGD